MGRISSFISFAAVAAVAAYLTYTSYVILKLFYPTWNVPLLGDTPVPEGASYHKPYYPPSQKFDLLLYLCPGTDLDDGYPFQGDTQCGKDPAWKLQSIDLDGAEEIFVEKNVTLPEKTRNNGTMVAHAYLVAEGKSADPRTGQRDGLLLHSATPLTRYSLLLPQNTTRNLLASDGGKADTKVQVTQPVPEAVIDEKKLPIVAHWKPVLHLEVVNDRNEYPFGMVPSDLPMRYVQTPAYPYLPILYINELGIQRKHLLPVQPRDTKAKTANENADPGAEMPLKITFRTVHLGMYRVGRSMGETFRLFSLPESPMKMSEKEIDNLRQMFFETEPRLLAATLFASIMHMLCDFLAFKSDIAHWRNKKTMAGVSRTSIILSTVGHLIAAFYLWDKRKETSSLVIGGSIVTAAVDIWKVTRLITHPPETAAEKDTAQIDSGAGKYAIAGSVICVAGYAGWSLLFREHTGYWSFLLDTAMWATYLLGFVNMTPQIFMNYRLKSVAAMPLQAFFFKAINTFVDDLFAFVIPMPTLTRLSVFRDDLIFFVLCFQWWIYPTRPADEDDKEKSDETAKDSAVVAAAGGKDGNAGVSTAVASGGGGRERRAKSVERG